MLIDVVLEVIEVRPGMLERNCRLNIADSKGWRNIWSSHHWWKVWISRQGTKRKSIFYIIARQEDRAGCIT